MLALKSRLKSKDFHYEGGSTDTLFGQHLFPTSGKRIVITEGELDAASCYEVMSGWPMVSLPHGAASAKKAYKNKSHSYRDTKRSSCSSTTTTQGVRPLNLPREYSRPVESKWLDSKIIKMLQMLSKLGMLTVSDEPSGMQNHTDQMEY